MNKIIFTDINNPEGVLEKPKPPAGETIVKKNPVDWRLNEETCQWDRIVFNDETGEWELSMLGGQID